MRLKKWKFALPKVGWMLALSGGLFLAACSDMESQPETADPLNLESGVDIAALMQKNPHLIHLEGDVTESFGEELDENARRRGIASDRARFNITLKYIVEPTERQREVFQAAADRWERIIIRDEVNFTGVTIPSSFPGQPPLVTPTEVLDDIIIEVNLTEIDGPGRVLGRAGPRFIRLPQLTTLNGLMEFDVADLAGLDAADLFEEVIVHEMGHVLGIGTLWQRGGLLILDSFETAVDPDYLGRFGNLYWKTEGGEGLLPVEGAFFDANGEPFFRQGTSFGHWDEEVLDNELMTGFLNGGVANPLSRITAGSVRDLGYGTATVGEQYELPSAGSAANRTLRMSDDGINIAEGEELIEPIGFITARRR